MAVLTKAILSAVMTEAGLQELICKSNGENVDVTYNGKNETLSAALAEIVASIGSAPTEEDVNTKISAAISELIGGAPETYDTLKEIADYIASHEETASALNAAIGNKVDKEEGKGLSSNDFTDALKTALENLPAITAADVASWNAKAGTAPVSETAAGLATPEMLARLNSFRGVRIGETAPADMGVGDVFIQISQVEGE